MFAREMVNKMRHNCPNCGAPINSVECPYCGTVLYDFATLDAERPTYIKIKYMGHTIMFRAYVRELQVDLQPDALPDVTIGLTGVPGKDGNYFVEKRNGRT